MNHRTLLLPLLGLTLTLGAAAAVFAAAPSADAALAGKTVVPTLALSPDEGVRGAMLEVAITGVNTSFADGMTAVSFGDGIAVTSLTVASATSATAMITIAADAELGPRDVTATTGEEVATLEDGFAVVPLAIVLVDPNGAFPGDALEVELVGAGTTFTRDESVVSFGDGIIVVSIAVFSETLIVATVLVEEDAEFGPRDVTVTTGLEIASRAGGFTVVPPPTLLGVDPFELYQGERVDVEIHAIYTHFVDGVTTASFGAGVTVLGLDVLNAENAVAWLEVDREAALGPRDVTVTTGAEVVVLAGGVTVSPPPPAADPPLAADFNGDGYSDLAIGVPGEAVNGDYAAGAANVIYGTASRLSGAGDQLWTEDTRGITGVGEVDDLLGSSLVTGDFNGDGYADLAIGIPGENLGEGSVLVLFGTDVRLRVTGHQVWSQATPELAGFEIPEAGDLFGASLAAGDFNGDGFADLAIGVPGESVGTELAAGAVYILHGSVRGLSGKRGQIWYQGLGGVADRVEAGDLFGFSLTAGDFDGDHYDDLAVGVPGEDLDQPSELVPVIFDAGAVNVLHGTASGLVGGGGFWHQDVPGILSSAEDGDAFGSSVATGDFDGDGYDDLAIGAPLDDIGRPAGPGGNASRILDAGGVNVIYGTSQGLTEHRNQFWNQNSARLAGRSDRDDFFGASLAVGDFDGNGNDDLVVGVPGDLVSGQKHAGAINLIFGSPVNGLIDTGNQRWHQNKSGVKGRAESRDFFGASVATGDYNGDGRSDLAIGVPGNNLQNVLTAGAVNVLYGRLNVGIEARNNQIWHQNSNGVKDQARVTDEFGAALGGH